MQLANCNFRCRQGGKRSGRLLAADLSKVAGRDVQVRECPQVERRLQGRQSGDLHADDPRATDRHAGLHEDRRDPQRGGEYIYARSREI